MNRSYLNHSSKFFAVLATLLAGCVFPASQTAAVAQSAETDVYVLMKTTAGDITLKLDSARAPISVANFVKYAEADHYNDTVFHRVIEDFMIQGGGFSKDKMNGEKRGTKAPIRNESGNGLKNDHYTIAMARTQALDSATSQFYINTKDNPDLDKGKYAVFGDVVKGKDVIDKIAKGRVRFANGEMSQPVDPIVITNVEVIQAPSE